MLLQTKVDIAASEWKISPSDRMLFVGSCFADNIGRRFLDEKFVAVVNPFGVMYNPVSVLHTISRLSEEERQNVDVTVITLGTNHVYRERSTGQIVDNCQKRPASLFQEEILDIKACHDALAKAVAMLSGHVIITVSPIRYRKYGYHESQLSKATLLLAADMLAKENPAKVFYFPAYELVNDELRDYRFYKADMLHPSDQAVEYIFERFAETYFSDETNKFLDEWRPLKEALGHRPLNPDSAEYKLFLEKTMNKVEALKMRYPHVNV